MGIEERKERERGVRREQILNAALDVYLETGYHGTTMEKMAEKAELSRATLYLYFKNKDEIFVHAIVSFLEYFGELLGDVYRRREEVGGRILETLWDVFKAFYHKNPVAFCTSLYFHQEEMIRNLPDHLRMKIDRTGSDNYKALCRIVEYGIGKGYFIPSDPRTLAEVIWTTFLGIIHLENSKRAMGRKNHLDATWDLAYQALSSGIVKGGPRGR